MIFFQLKNKYFETGEGEKKVLNKLRLISGGGGPSGSAVKYFTLDLSLSSAKKGAEGEIS